MTKHYISNKEFFEEIISWQNNCGELNKLPRKILDKIQALIDRYSQKWCFRFYNNLDDMKAEAMYRCLLGLYSFNYDRSNNPFAFFTSCIKNSYFQNINSEKDDARFKFSVVSEKIDDTHKMDFREDSEKREYTEDELIVLEESAMNDIQENEAEIEEELLIKKKRKVKVDNYFETGFCTFIETNIKENVKIMDDSIVISDNIDHSLIKNVNVYNNNPSQTFESFLNDE